MFFFPLIEIEMCKSKYFLEYCNCVLLKKCCKFILCISYINIFLKGNSCKTAYLHFILHFVCLCFFETIFLCCPDWPQTPVFLSHLPESWAHRYSHIYIYPVPIGLLPALLLVPSFSCVTRVPLSFSYP